MKKTLLLTSLLGMLLIASTAQARHSDGYLNRIVIEGYVESIRGQVAYVADDCGITFRVHLGPSWYWDERDYFLRSGSWVTIVAWQDPYDDYCYAGEIRGRDFCYDLCDGRGYPRWYDRHQCHTGWRPTRVFFDVCFVFNSPVWHANHPHHRYWRNDCDDDWGRDHRRHWRDDDRDRDGRRGGGRYSSGGDNDHYDKPIGGFNSQVEKPRYVEKNPGRGDGGNNYKVEKPRTTDMPRGSIGGNSNKTEKSRGTVGNSGKSTTKSYGNSSKSASKSYGNSGKSASKSSRKSDSGSNKTWARK